MEFRRVLFRSASTRRRERLSARRRARLPRRIYAPVRWSTLGRRIRAANGSPANRAHEEWHATLHDPFWSVVCRCAPCQRFEPAAWPSERRAPRHGTAPPPRSEEHTSELQSLLRISYAVFCLKKKKHKHTY